MMPLDAYGPSIGSAIGKAHSTVTSRRREEELVQLAMIEVMRMAEEKTLSIRDAVEAGVRVALRGLR